MKILHVLKAPRAEGTPRLVLDWLTQEQYAQEILFLCPNGDLKQEFQQHSVWQHYNTAFPLCFRNVVKVVTLVKHICVQRQPDLVIAWTFGFSHWISIGASLARVKFKLAHAGNPAGDGMMAKYIHPWVIIGLGALFGNRIVACSDYVKHSYTSIPFISKRQFYSVYNCVQVEKYLADRTARRQMCAIMVATLEDHKDHKTLVEAWKIIEESGVHIPLKIAGGGTLKNDLQNYCSKLGLKLVDFLGSRNDIPDLLRSSSIFILSTTVQEGFGTVLIEALAAGCIVIATDVPACREVLQNGLYGYLVRAADPAALAEAIMKVSRERQVHFAEDQVVYARKFSPALMAEQYLHIAKGH